MIGLYWTVWISKKSRFQLGGRDAATLAEKNQENKYNFINTTLWLFNIAMENHHF
jgi:hypothetical protein